MRYDWAKKKAYVIDTDFSFFLCITPLRNQLSRDCQQHLASVCRGRASISVTLSVLQKLLFSLKTYLLSEGERILVLQAFPCVMRVHEIGKRSSTSINKRNVLNVYLTAKINKIKQNPSKHKTR